MNCWICGKLATTVKPTFDGVSWDFPKVSSYYRCYCEECLKELTKRESEERKLYVKLRKRMMFRKACDTLEKQRTKMYEYQEAINVVRDFVEEQPDKFDSSYEMLAAIVLVHNRIHAKMQQRIGRYQVDFLLPELFVILEIDGERHKYKKQADSERDLKILNALGPHWEIIRIPTEHLDKDAKQLPKAIEKVLKYRETNHVNWRELYAK